MRQFFCLVGLIPLLVFCNSEGAASEMDKDVLNQCGCLPDTAITTIMLDSTNMLTYIDTISLKHGQVEELSFQMMYINEAGFDPDNSQTETENLWVLLHGDEFLGLPISASIYSIPSHIGSFRNCLYNYCVIDITTNKQPRQNNTLTDLIHIPLSELDWNKNDLILLRVNGGDKKVIGTSTSKWPKGNC